MQKILLETKKKEDILDITEKIKHFIQNQEISNGILFLYLPHTTCSIVIAEKDDPALKYDFLKVSKMLSQNYVFKHVGGNGEAHFKSSLFGVDLTLFITDKKLMLGEWQGIFFMEFDGPRKRELWIKIQKEN